MPSELAAKNGNVPCTPFPDDLTKPAGRGLAIVTKKNYLVPLKVVAGHHNDTLGYLIPGDTVYVMSTGAGFQWGREKFTVDGIDGEFILVPSGVIVMVKRLG
jgi:hypothetical protein